MKLPAFWRISLLYSTIAAVSCFALVILLYSAGLNPFGNLKNLSWAIYGATFALAMRAYHLQLLKPFQWYHGITLGLVINLVTPSLYFSLLYLSLQYTPVGNSVYDKYLPAVVAIAKDQVTQIVKVRPQVTADELTQYQEDSTGYQQNYQVLSTIQQERNMDFTIMAVDHAYLIKGLFPLGFVLTFVFTLFSVYTLRK